MKKLLMLTLLISLNVHAQSIEVHIADSVRPIGKVLEGKKGKVVLGTFKSVKATDTCAPSKSVNSKISSALAKAGVKTVVASRTVNMDADQSEISRVTKLSGGSYIILGTYEVVGVKFKIDCSVYDHNGASVGACDDATPVTLSAEQAELINCPVTPEEKPKTEIPALKNPENEEITITGSESGDGKLKKIDEYICSVIHKDYDLKRLVMSLYEKKMYTLEDLKGIRKTSSEDALEVAKDNCVSLGNFVLCSDYWEGSGAQIFLGDASSLGNSKILSWKHPNKSRVTNAKRCLKKDDNWWNP